MIPSTQPPYPKRLKRFSWLSFSLLMGLCMVVLLLALLRFEARADTLCVNPSGGEGCQATISQALELAGEET